MKKLGVYAHQRSGSSILYEVIGRRSGTPLSECFNPNDDSSLVEINGNLENIKHEQLPEDEVQSRDTRLKYMQRHNHQDYFIKVFGIDMRHGGIREYVRSNYELIAIERRNSLSAVFSGLIAIQHWYFNDTVGEPPEYQPFVAKYQHFSFMTDALLSYYKHKDDLNIRMTYVYEDMIKMSRPDILRELNLGKCGAIALPLRKLLDFKAKVNLIQNYDEVLFWYKTDLEPHLPENRQGGYS